MAMLILFALSILLTKAGSRITGKIGYLLDTAFRISASAHIRGHGIRPRVQLLTKAAFYHLGNYRDHLLRDLPRKPFATPKMRLG